jgi:signal transduction histidine kinase
MMTLGGALVLGAVLVVLVVMSWRSVERLEPLSKNLFLYAHLEQVHRVLTDRLTSATTIAIHNTQSVADTASLLQELARQNGYLYRQTPDKLRHVANLLLSEKRTDMELHNRLPRAVPLLHELIHQEVAAQQAMLQELKVDNGRELDAAIAIAVILALLAVLFWMLFQRLVLHPLEDLGYGMGLLARKDFRTVEVSRIDPVIRPVFDQYNRLVGRLQDLEAGHVKRETALKENLEMTTGDLVKHQAMLARADRLAALGEMSARMAHRLRNPLSGVLVTLTNLRDETVSVDHRERLRKSIEALLRSFQELTELVEEARQEPEPSSELSLNKIVTELFMLMKHQLEEESLHLQNRVSSNLVCKLPESGMRHALMILLMNASEAQQSSAEGYIRVTAEESADRLCIVVKDGGPGFSEAQLHSVSDECNTWTQRGSDLGLAIVRRFVELLGGHVILRNPSDGGAEAILNIPKEETSD